MKRFACLYIPIIICAAIMFVGNANVNTLTVYDGESRYEYADERIEPTNHLVSEEIFEYKINGCPREKIEYVINSVKKGKTKKQALIDSFPKLKEFVRMIDEKTLVEPVDSLVKFEPNNTPKFTLTREKKGRKLDENAFYADLYKEWQKNSQAVIRLKFTELRPDVTVEDTKARTFMRGGFLTDYARSSENRKSNIALALSKINGIKIPKNAQFSFNETVGKRTERNGFKSAKIIVDGEYIDGVGGGVCQVSTTLYNAALLSGMNIDEVGSHSLPPSYVEASFDAMVNSGSRDLKFTNRTDGDVFIRAVCDGKRITVEFYGAKNEYKIVRKSKIIKTDGVPEDKIIVDSEGKYTSEEMESGEMIRIRSGIAGFESEACLLYYKDGRLMRERLIRKDKYRSVRGILAKKP